MREKKVMLTMMYIKQCSYQSIVKPVLCWKTGHTCGAKPHLEVKGSIHTEGHCCPWNVAGNISKAGGS
jgi:hypothetical protein